MIKIFIPPAELSFSFARSSGPGGQNVNKVSSKAILQWNVFSTDAVSREVQNRFARTYRNRISADGVITITSGKTRSQELNKEDCVSKLLKLLQAVLIPPKRRIKTRVPGAERRRRRDSKRKVSEKKLTRRRPAED